MKLALAAAFTLLQAVATSAFAGNSVVNLSHYDLMRPDFESMRRQGIVGVIHEATYPPSTRDERYLTRQEDATRAGLLWGAYHYANATNPVRQADFFLSTVQSCWRNSDSSNRPDRVLLVLDFEKNGHYPGGTMRVDQAVAFVERIHERTGKYPGLYSGEYRIQRVLNSPSVTGAQKEILARCWLWVANYHYEPRTVAPWSSWSLWQYTGDGVCDLPSSSFPKSIANIPRAERNRYRGDDAALKLFWQLHSWDPAE
jgi:lysozyme